MPKLTPAEKRAKRTAEREMFDQFVADHPRCWICGDRTLLENHHIASGAGRIHDRRNLLRLCLTCHDEYIHESKEMWHNHAGIANELALKYLRDRDHYDREFINAARFTPPGADGITADDVRTAFEHVKEIVKW